MIRFAILFLLLSSNVALRLLRLYRAHGLIKKISHTSYYRVTTKGQRIMSVALRLREIDIPQLAA